MNLGQEKLSRLRENIEKVIFGKSETIDFAITCLLAKGHLLIEDVPGVGKTSLAQCLANSLQLDFKRIQFTNDLLPTDITGVSIYDQEEKRFHFQKGPLFANIVLADEINRASPRTQSALLEAMASGTACVATDAGADGEVLEGGAGIVLSTQGVTTQLRTLLPVLRDQPVLTAELGRRARIRALDRYTINRNIDAIETLYDDLLRTQALAA